MKKKIIVQLGFIVFAHLLFAQTGKIDSLKKVLRTAADDTNKIKALNDLSLELNDYGRFTTSDSVVRLALQLSEKLNYKPGIMFSYRNLGVVCWFKADYTAAYENYNKALKVAQDMGDKHTMARIIGNIGLVLESKGDYLGALEYYQKALKSYEEQNDKRGQAKYLGSIGVIYRRLGNYPKALEWYFKAIKIDEQTGDKSDNEENLANLGIVYDDEGDYKDALQYDSLASEIMKQQGDKMLLARNIGNMAIIYDEEGNHTKALEYFFKALAISTELGDKESIALHTGNIGIEYKEQGKYDSALVYDTRALKIRQDIGDKDGIARNLGSIGAVYVQEKKYDEGEAYLQKALVLAAEVGSIEMVKEDQENLGKLYTETKQWEKALNAYQEYIKAKDSLVNKEKSKEIGKLEAKADFDKQLAVKQEEENKDKEVSEAESKRQRIVIVFVGTLALGIACIAFIVFRSLKITRRQKVLIEEQKSIVEEKNKDITDSIHYASRIQNALLTSQDYIGKYLKEYFILFKPRDIVSGDFYWAFIAPVSQNNQGTIYMACCDCTGHGVPGAFMSLLNISMLNESVIERKILSPDLVLNDVRNNIIKALNPDGSDKSKDGMDCALSCIDIEKMEMLCAAANNPIWIIRQDGSLHEIMPDKMPVGIHHGEQKPFAVQKVQLNKGDCIYMFTDGYADQFGGPKGKKFKYKQLQEKLLAVSHKPMVKQKQELETVLEQWKGNLEQVDDILIIGIRV